MNFGSWKSELLAAARCKGHKVQQGLQGHEKECRYRRFFLWRPCCPCRTCFAFSAARSQRRNVSLWFQPPPGFTLLRTTSDSLWFQAPPPAFTLVLIVIVVSPRLARASSPANQENGNGAD